MQTHDSYNGVSEKNLRHEGGIDLQGMPRAPKQAAGSSVLKPNQRVRNLRITKSLTPSEEYWQGLHHGKFHQLDA